MIKRCVPCFSAGGKLGRGGLCSSGLSAQCSPPASPEPRSSALPCPARPTRTLCTHAAHTHTLRTHSARTHTHCTHTVHTLTHTLCAHTHTLCTQTHAHRTLHGVYPVSFTLCPRAFVPVCAFSTWYLSRVLAPFMHRDPLMTLPQFSRFQPDCEFSGV